MPTVFTKGFHSPITRFVAAAFIVSAICPAAPALAQTGSRAQQNYRETNRQLQQQMQDQQRSQQLQFEMNQIRGQQLRNQFQPLPPPPPPIINNPPR